MKPETTLLEYLKGMMFGAILASNGFQNMDGIRTEGLYIKIINNMGLNHERLPLGTIEEGVTWMLERSRLMRAEGRPYSYKIPGHQ